MIGALIGAGLSIASSIAGNIAAKRQRNAAKAKVNEQLLDNQRWRDRNYYQDPTKRTDTIRLLSQLRDTIRERSQAAKGRQAVMGGTDASVESVREANNKTLADATGNIVAANEARKDRIDEIAEQNKRALKGQQAEMAAADAANTAKTVQEIAGVAGHIANGLDSTIPDKSDDTDVGTEDLMRMKNDGEADADTLSKMVNKTYAS